MNRLWGAERIRGELLKLGMHVCKRTIQKYMRHVHAPRPGGQRWATFLHNHNACSMHMWRTSTGHDRIKVFSNRSLNSVDRLVPLSIQGAR
jgi:hypothetical protein